MDNSATPPPGSSAGNTAHPQTRGSTNKDKENKTGREGVIKKAFTTFIFMTMYCVWLDIAQSFSAFLYTVCGCVCVSVHVNIKNI